MISNNLGLTILVIYGAAMLLVSYFFISRPKSKDEFIVSNRNVGPISGGFSIAATWIWAPALFVATQQAYFNGISGLFWFTVPNVLCLILFAYFALKLRSNFPEGYTLSEFMTKTYSKRVGILYIIELSGLAICQFAVQILAGGIVINFITGIDFYIVSMSLVFISLAYSLLSGIKASILTDLLQMILIILLLIIIVPFLIIKSGGLETILNGISGINRDHPSLFDFNVFYSFGIPVTLGLLAGPFGDQSFWQRTFSIKKDKIKQSFYISALVFMIVPIMTGILGFLASGLGLDVSRPDVIGLTLVSNIAPGIFLILFTIILLSGLISTLDSALCSISSIFATDIHQYFPKVNAISIARIGMLILAFMGFLISIIPGMKILYLFLFYGTLRATTFFPTILTILKGAQNEKHIFYSIAIAIFLGAPIMAYGNFNGILDLKVFGAIFVFFSPLIIIIVGKLFTNK